MNQSIQPSKTAGTLSLFQFHPQLASRLPRVALGCFPTPVQPLVLADESIKAGRLYIKRDDLSGLHYGGNKVRKLEFLLADALRAGAKEVVTLGFAGSNHALATAIYANQLGLRCTSLLMPQVNAHYVRRNLLASHRHGARLMPCANLLTLSLRLLFKLARPGVRLIPAGGSCPLGVIGYVNAAFELKEQIIAGEIPEPDFIYVPMGSMGTSAGLILGLKAAGLKSQVIAVRVIEEKFANVAKMRRLLDATQALLRRSDPGFPQVKISASDLNIREDCLGEGYARFTEKAVRAAEIMRQATGIHMNGSYSAKAFSALLDDAKRQVLKDKTTLFWNTYNSRDQSAATVGVDYRQLPRGFHRYFEQEVQALDKDGLDR